MVHQLMTVKYHLGKPSNSTSGQLKPVAAFMSSQLGSWWTGLFPATKCMDGRTGHSTDMKKSAGTAGMPGEHFGWLVEPERIHDHVF